MCVHVNALPDDCLLPVFDLIPLSELLQLDIVCPRWAALLPSACTRRHTLVLFFGVFGWQFNIPYSAQKTYHDDGRLYYDLPVLEREQYIAFSSFVPNKSFDNFLLDDSKESGGFFDILYDESNSMGDGSPAMDSTEMARFHNARVSGELVTYLRARFPNVTTLVVVHSQCHGEDEHRSVAQLVRSWPLSTLKLWLVTETCDDEYVDRPNSHPIYPILCSIITQQASLRELTLEIYNQTATGRPFNFPLDWRFTGARLSVLKLSFGLYSCVDQLSWDIVARFDGPTLAHIDLAIPTFSPVDAILNGKLDYTTKVRQLYMDNLWIRTGVQLARLCRQFPSLTLVSIEWPRDVTFGQLVSKLASLGQLAHLKLNLGDIRDFPVNAFGRVMRADGDGGGGLEELVPLPQVKILGLRFRSRSHRDFVSLSPQVFPSVETITVSEWSSECTICRPATVHFHIYSQEVAWRCHRQLIRWLKFKFARSLVRLYEGVRDDEYVDWMTEPTEDDDDEDLFEIGDGDGEGDGEGDGNADADDDDDEMMIIDDGDQQEDVDDE